MGDYVSLDDFGTGYSSLSYLRRLPVNTLKIDKSFIDGLISDRAQVAYISSIVDIAHSLGLNVIAEGVETCEQLEQLVECRCDFIQGYLFSRPIPAEDNIFFLSK